MDTDRNYLRLGNQWRLISIAFYTYPQQGFVARCWLLLLDNDWELRWTTISLCKSRSVSIYIWR